jgi:poly(A) polymerase
LPIAKEKSKESIIVNPTVIARPDHNISRGNISENALKVLYRLRKSGYQAYLVGGGVRDLLLGREPKDFDIATDATPEDVKKVFRNCRLIGRRFRLAHVHFGREVIEVATFRGIQEPSEDGGHETENGMLLRDNVYGSIEEDALRRDFTVNALYYNIDDFSVIDYTNGVDDLNSCILRLLGDPEQRYREDPVRMLRAVRFAAKLGFSIDPVSEEPIFRLASLLEDIPSARLFEEVLKLFLHGTALQAFEKLRHYDLFGQLFPATDECLSHEEHQFPITFVANGLKNTDTRVMQDKPVTPAFLFAVLLWEPVRKLAEKIMAGGENPHPAMQLAASEILSDQIQTVAIPKRFSLQMRDIWCLQHRFEYIQGKRPHRLLAHPRFRAGYDFMLLRAESGESDPELAKWWTEFQQLNGEEQNRLVKDKRPKRRRRRRSKSDSGSDKP